MSLSNWSEAFKSIDEELKFLKSADCELRQNLNLIYRGLSKFVIPAKKLEYNGLQANGYWSFIKICVKFCNLIEQNLEDLDNRYNDFVLISRYLVALTNLMDNLKEKLLVKSNALPRMPDAPFTVYPELYVLPMQHPEEISVIFGKYPGFWLAQPFSKSYRNLSTVAAVCGSPLHRLASLLWDKTLLGSFALKSLMNLNVSGLAKLSRITEALSIPALRFLTYYPIVDCKDVFVRPKASFVLDGLNGNIKKVEERESAPPIRCRLINNVKWTKNKALVLQCHGGGFVTGTPDLDEGLYLREWSHQVPNCAILSVDYALGVPFLVPLQQMVDVYFWLIDGENAEEQLGFRPSKIVLCGDSAGATLVFTLLLVLNDIRNLYKLSDTVMPSSVISIYGSYCKIPISYPSRVISLIDNVLFAGSLLALHDRFPGRERSQDLNPDEQSYYSQIKGWMNSCIKIIFPQFYAENRPWYLSSKRNFQYFLQKTLERASTPYAIPLSYGNFDHIKVPLFLISAHYCPLLDETITLAKLWKGPVTLDVFDGVPHGFLHLGYRSKETSTIHTLCIKRLKEAVRQVNFVKDD